MTLLSNAFCAAPSTTNDTITVNDRRSVSYSPSTSPSTAATFNEPSPSQVLAMTIKKKRRVLRSKARNLRVEILLTSTIRRLCQEIGDHLRSRRVASAKRKVEENESTTPTVRLHVVKRSRQERDDEPVKKQEVGLETSIEAKEQSSNSSVGPLALDDQPLAVVSQSENVNSDGQSRKRKADSEDDSLPRKQTASFSSGSEDTFNEKDPFGLDEFFRSMRTCRVGGSKR